MRKLLYGLAIVGSLVLLAPSNAWALDEFNSEAAAQRHCPADVVVWLNIPTGIWHYKGNRWYGTTKNGAYVCMKEAKAAGMRASKSG